MLNWNGMTHEGKIKFLKQFFTFASHVPDSADYFWHNMGIMPAPTSFMFYLVEGASIARRTGQESLGRMLGLNWGPSNHIEVDGKTVENTRSFFHKGGEFASGMLFWMETPTTMKKDHLCRIAYLYQLVCEGADLSALDLEDTLDIVRKKQTQVRLVNDVFPMLRDTRMRFTYDTEPQC